MLRRTLLTLAAGVAAAQVLLNGGAGAQEPCRSRRQLQGRLRADREQCPPRADRPDAESMQAKAANSGHQLVYTDAAGSAAKQVADVKSMIAQGVDLIFLAPREEKP